MTDDLNALADRIEAATGPDREIDAEIVSALGIIAPCWCTGACEVAGQVCVATPKFSASLDAALPLLLNCGLRLLDIEIGFEPPHPEVWPAASVRWYPPRKDGKDWHAMVVTAATLPLTLCAAALRARAQQEGQR